MLTVLQIDAASVSLLERMLKQGRLPALGGLRERGVWHELVAPEGSSAAHYSAYSGLEPADHGVATNLVWSAAEQRLRSLGRVGTAPLVWERFPDRSPCLVIDPYAVRPPHRPPPGMLLGGWQAANHLNRSWSVPAGLSCRLETLFGSTPDAREVYGRNNPNDLLRLRRSLLTQPGRVADAATFLLAEQRFTVAWLTFTAAHVGGHRLWDLTQLDREVDDRTRRVLGSALEEIYQSVDAALGKILTSLPEGSDVIVTSPIGMEANTSRIEFLPDMLDAVLNPDAGSSPERHNSGGAAIWRIRAAVPQRARSRAADLLPDRLAQGLLERLEMGRRDWAHTRAFTLPAESIGFVHLNLRGRERDGIVAPEQAEDVLDEIAAGLLGFRDPDGVPAVSAVRRYARSFGPGPYADRLPDLAVHWNDRLASSVTSMHSERFGTVHRRGSRGRTGEHPGGGAWALLVPGSSRVRPPARPPRLVDVAATFAAAAGADLTDLAGEPLFGD